MSLTTNCTCGGRPPHVHGTPQEPRPPDPPWTEEDLKILADVLTAARMTLRELLAELGEAAGRVAGRPQEGP